MSNYRKKSAKKKNKNISATRVSAVSGLTAFFAAAIAVPGISVAQSRPDDALAEFRYINYSDYQGSQDRMKVNSPMAYLRTPIGKATEIEGSVTYDSMSGASPLYLNALSGASGKGIHDSRGAADVKVTQYFQDYSIGVGAAYSTENDYDARTLSIESRFWTPDKNTTFAFGLSGSDDSVSSSIDKTLSKNRNAGNVLVGVTQVINPISSVQSNLTFGDESGYLSDPYKTLDTRPDHRTEFAWLTRYVLYVAPTKGAVHLDYRFYDDSFGVQSHMMEASYYQPFLDSWMIRPSVRYYSQTAADFFTGSFPPANPGDHFTADQRLAAFGSITAGIKLIKSFDSGLSLDVSVDQMEQKAGYQLGGSGSDSIGSFGATWFGVGVSQKF